jgi:hypothetical protein
MRAGPLLAWSCVASVALVGCGRSEPSPQTSPAVQSSPGHTTTAPPIFSEEPQERTTYSLEASPDLPLEHRDIADEFLRFAAKPNQTTAKAVPFYAPISVSVNGREQQLQGKDISNPTAWLVSDGEGTTSALFVISNSIRLDRGAEFLATDESTSICNLTEPSPSPSREQVYITRIRHEADCAEGFVVGLTISSDQTIREVSLTVRAP